MTSVCLLTSNKEMLSVKHQTLFFYSLIGVCSTNFAVAFNQLKLKSISSFSDSDSLSLPVFLEDQRVYNDLSYYEYNYDQSSCYAAITIIHFWQEITFGRKKNYK